VAAVKPQQKPRGLIFDVDGTLAETEELHRKAFNALFNEYNLDWHWDREFYKTLLQVNGGRKRLQYFIEHHNPSRAGDFIDSTAEMHKKKTAIYGQLIRTGNVALRPGIEKLIRQAVDQGLALGISTATGRGNVETLFKATLGLDVLDKFSAICTGDEVSENKPSPALYLLALERLGLAGRECLAFEDSQFGVQSARAAGIAVIVTKSLYCADDDFTGAEQVMDDLVSGGFRLSTVF
jgi:HAD superfamily hydrolase (TIGR01509 family)